MRDRLDGVSVFVTVVEAGGFSKAAERLALSRSAVAKTVARLEDRLGARLFHRTTRSQSLTQDGEAYFAHCARALDAMRAGEAELVARRNEATGRLKVTMPVLFGRRHVEPILIEMARENGALELDMRFNDAPVDILAEGFDLAIRIGSAGRAAGLRTRKVATLQMVVCAAPTYLTDRVAPVEASDLHRHETLVFRLNGQPHVWPILDRAGQPLIQILKSRFQFDNYESMVDAAIRGAGIACLSSWAARAGLADGRLVRLLDDHPAATRGIYAVWPSSPAMPASLRMAIDRLATQLPALLG